MKNESLKRLHLIEGAINTLQNAKKDIIKEDSQYLIPWIEYSLKLTGIAILLDHIEHTGEALENIIEELKEN